MVVGRAGFPAVLVGRRWRATGTTVADVASAYQSLARYRLAKTAGFVPPRRPATQAARHGLLDVLQWLVNRGCEWDARTCAAAAKGRHLEVLKWLVNSGCDWDARTCTCAAEGGHLEMLEWARANGCPK